MRYRPLGQSGIEASVIGFGAWAIGGWRWGGTDEADSIAAIHAALDAGINLIDTAAVYAFGYSEELVGKAIAGRRDRVVLATKCGLIWEAKKGMHHFDSEGRSIYRYLTPDSIREEVERSLKRLNTDYIDLYQTHWQDPTHPIEDTMATLLALKEEGKIRAIGVSNATVEDMDAYRRGGPLDTDQERYSMLDRGHERAILPYCREHGIAFIAYSPLAQGLLTGKIGPDRTFPEGDLRNENARFSQDNRARVAALLAELQPLAGRRGSNIEHLILAWTLERPGLSHVLAGARNPAQAAGNARAGDIRLTDEELAAIDAALARFPGLAL